MRFFQARRRDLSLRLVDGDLYFFQVTGCAGVCRALAWKEQGVLAVADCGGVSMPCPIMPVEGVVAGAKFHFIVRVNVSLSFDSIHDLLA